MLTMPSFKKSLIVGKSTYALELKLITISQLIDALAHHGLVLIELLISTVLLVGISILI